MTEAAEAVVEQPTTISTPPAQAAQPTPAKAVPEADDGMVVFGDKRVETSTVDRYKGRKNVVDRIAIVTKGLLRRHVYYYNKKSFIAPDQKKNKELYDLCVAQLGPPSQRFGILIFHYTTDSEGALEDETKLKGKVKIWLLSEGRYEEMTNLSKQWPIADKGFKEPQNDLLVRCTEEQFQRMTIQPLPNALWKSTEERYNAIQKKITVAMPTLKKAFGKELTDEEIMAVLGAPIPNQTGTTANANDIDLSDVVA